MYQTNTDTLPIGPIHTVSALMLVSVSHYILNTTTIVLAITFPQLEYNTQDALTCL